MAHAHARSKREKEKRGEKVNDYSGTIVSERPSDQNKSARQAENEYESFEHDDRRSSKLMDRQLKHNMGIMEL